MKRVKPDVFLPITPFVRYEYKIVRHENKDVRYGEKVSED